MTSPADRAAEIIVAAGFTPCTASAFVDELGRAFAFSVESVSGRSSSGPAFSAVVTATGVESTTGTPRNASR